MAEEKICPIMSNTSKQVVCLGSKCKWAMQEPVRGHMPDVRVNCTSNASALRHEDIRAAIAQELMLLTAAVKQMRWGGRGSIGRTQKNPANP